MALDNNEIYHLIVKSYYAFLTIQNLEVYNLGVEIELRYLEGRIHAYLDCCTTSAEEREQTRYRAYMEALEQVTGNN